MLKVLITCLDNYSDDLIFNLSSEQINKALKYKIDDDKKRSILSSSLLNHVLKNIGLTYDSIIYNEYGKPYLRNNELYFNLSHSGKYIVCAVSNYEVGIDIEKIRPKSDLVINKCFTKEEQNIVYDDNTFTHIWTLKESYIKQIGTGLKTKLDSFSVYENGNITNIDDLMFKTLKIEDYYLSICHNVKEKIQFEYLNLC